MEDRIILRLPFNFGAQKENWLDSLGVKRFNPGLSEKNLKNRGRAGFFTPVMPFSPEQADRILLDMKECLLNNFQTLLHGLTPLYFADSRSRLAECASLADFAEGTNHRERDTRRRLDLEQNQKLLIWKWAQEELLLEMDVLERKLDFQEKNLQEIFDYKPVSFFATSENGSAWADGWQKWLKSFAYFLPESSIIFLEGPLAAALGESFVFKKATLSEIFALPDDREVQCLYACMAELIGEDFKTSRPMVDDSLTEALLFRHWWIISDAG